MQNALSWSHFVRLARQNCRDNLTLSHIQLPPPVFCQSIWRERSLGNNNSLEERCNRLQCLRTNLDNLIKHGDWSGGFTPIIILGLSPRHHLRIRGLASPQGLSCEPHQGKYWSKLQTQQNCWYECHCQSVSSEFQHQAERLCASEDCNVVCQWPTTFK